MQMALHCPERESQKHKHISRGFMLSLLHTRSASNHFFFFFNRVKILLHGTFHLFLFSMMVDSLIYDIVWSFKR